MTSPHQYPGFYGSIDKGNSRLFWRSSAFHKFKAGSTRFELSRAIQSRPLMQQDIRSLDHVVDVVDDAATERDRNRIEPSAIHLDSSKAHQRGAGWRVA